jgi:hypothetical protein
MDVHDAAEKVVGNEDKLKKAGQTNEVGLMLSAVIENDLTEGFERADLFARDDGRGNIGLTSPGEPKSVGPIRDDKNDIRRQLLT